jgi:hypothetical protein
MSLITTYLPSDSFLITIVKGSVIKYMIFEFRKPALLHSGTETVSYSNINLG